MHRSTTVVCLAAAALIGPLATPGSAAPTQGAELTNATYVDQDTLTVTGRVTCTAGHHVDLQVVVTQTNGAVGAGTGEATCTGRPQKVAASINNISDVDFVRGQVTTDLYGGSFLCDAESCHDVNLADHLIQTFRLRR